MEAAGTRIVNRFLKINMTKSMAGLVMGFLARPVGREPNLERDA